MEVRHLISLTDHLRRLHHNMCVLHKGLCMVLSICLKECVMTI